MTTMENVIVLVNRIQRACTVLGDHGGGDGAGSLATLWEALPSVAVVGGQVRHFPSPTHGRLLAHKFSFRSLISR
jgi:hypothetical protein